MLAGNLNEGGLSVRSDVTEKETARRICAEIKNAPDDSKWKLNMYIAFDQKTIPEINKLAEEYWSEFHNIKKRANMPMSDYPLSPNFLMHDNKRWVYRQLTRLEGAVAKDILLYEDDPEQEFPYNNYERSYVLLNTSIQR